MQELPVEVWLCVTENLDDEELQALIGVNSFFFNLGMDTRYGELMLDTSEEQAMGHYLDHLMGPQVAKRVKKLTVHLQPAPPAAHRPPSPPSFGKRFAARIRATVRRIIPDRSVSLAASHLPQAQSDLSPYDLAQKLTKVLSCMVSVTDFRIVTWAMSQSKHLDAVYAAAWDTFGDNLSRVSLCAHLEGHQALIDSNPRLAKVEVLELEFSDNIAAQLTGSGEGAEALVGTVVPFVNKLSPQVKTLKIRSWGKIDLSHFFFNLKTFPNMESTLIRIPFNYLFGEDRSASGLARLLRESPALVNVALRLTPLGLALEPNREEALCDWLKDLLSDPLCFSRAKEIDICPTHLPGGMDILRLCIDNSRTHLQTFKLRDRYLHPEDVLSLVPELQQATSLTRLRLNVFKLSAPMFDAFARSLLRLKFLWLSIGDTESGSSGSLDVFRDNMKSRRYDNWKLWDLSIWQGGSELDGETMLAISQSIPSLRSFWEMGHKRLHEEGSSHN